MHTVVTLSIRACSGAVTAVHDAKQLAGVDARRIADPVPLGDGLDPRQVARSDRGQGLAVTHAVGDEAYAVLVGSRLGTNAKQLTGVDAVRIGQVIEGHQVRHADTVGGRDLAQRLAGLHDDHPVVGELR